MIKALFLDIDGTLVSFKTHQIPASAVAALEAAKAAGVKIFIATGRPVAIINNINAIKHLVDGYVAANGACCYVGDKQICHREIPPESVLKIMDYVDRHHITCFFVGRRDLLVCHLNDYSRGIFQNKLAVENLPTNMSVSEIEHEGIVQMTPFLDADQEKEALAGVKGCVAARWYPAFIDITAEGADKGNGIATVCAHEGIGLSDVMAIGDGGNDVPMLERAGVGVAMGNASDDVKAKADYVTADVDTDGIAQALKHYGVI